MSEELLSTAEKWVEIIKSQRSSGESVKGYCLERGLQEHQYYYWRRKLAKAESSAFTELTVIPQPAASCNIVLTLPGGYKLEIPSSRGSVEQAKELVKFLEAA